MDTQKPSEMPDDVFNQCLKQAMDQNKEKLDLSKDEQEKFMNAMQKPEFTKLMKDYMDEISDPKHRAEQEAYLEQLEKDNKVPENVNLVHPKAGFCLKLKRKEKNAEGIFEHAGKLFVNICQIDQVEKPKATKKGAGVSWSLPYSLGPMRHENDRSNQPHPTFDFAMNPDSIYRCKTDARFQKMVIDTAVDAVQQRITEVLQAEIQLEKETARVLRGVEAIGGKPAIMQLPKSKDNMKENKQTQSVTSSPIEKASVPKKQQPVQVLKPANEPKYTITHRGQIDLADFVNSDNRTIRCKRPKELVIKIQVPKVKSAKYLDVETSELALKLACNDKKIADYVLNLDLPYPVLEEKGSAKFDKTKRVLEITLPVQPPPQSEKLVDIAQPATLEQEEGKLVEEITSGIGTHTLTKDVSVDQKQDQPKEDTLAKEVSTDHKQKPIKHDRWVSKPSQAAITSTEKEKEDEEDEKKQEATKLEEILAAAKKAAQLPLPKAEDHSPPQVPEPARGTPDTVEELEETPEMEQGDNIEVTGEFQSSKVFLGPRVGYVFKSGGRGTGYYKDVARATPTPTITQKSDTPREEEQNPIDDSSKTERKSTLQLRNKAIFELD
uniref:Protein kintoun n=1 Tax=Mucochytrium quahogii TaxID=96639 RepID=A0A7S2S5N0_9STRA